ncbi:hypothetical protein M0802_004475 [Mischocyttarus mexicanus]|nr:hypothetical protein M0802_004475 [Mischocyttarus mexicanus]
MESLMNMNVFTCWRHDTLAPTIQPPTQPLPPPPTPIPFPTTTNSNSNSSRILSFNWENPSKMYLNFCL